MTANSGKRVHGNVLLAAALLLAGGLLVGLLLAAPWALAQSPQQSYDLSWYTVDGGGGMWSTGGDYALGGTAGQPDPGVLAGGSYTLGGGFWKGGALAAPSYGVYLPVVLREFEHWRIEMVDNAGDRSWPSPSLALDGAGRPCIAYTIADPDGVLKYAYDDGTGWMNEPLDSTTRAPSLVLDAAGLPHIIYYDTTSGDLKYIYNDGLSWQSQIVDSTGDVGLWTSLALDAAGLPHISYYDATNGDLKYIYNDGLSWQSQVVDSAGDVGAWTSLALDAAGLPHIGYYDMTNQATKYAYSDGTGLGVSQGWHIETVEAGLGSYGGYTSLTLDSYGRPHISYRDWDPLTYLKYAHYDGSVWQIETVDVINPPFEGISLALDSAERPHISFKGAYYCFHYNCWFSVEYAWHNGTAWQARTVALVGVAGSSGGNSLALDAADQPHIAYYDVSNNSIMYAWKP